MSDSPLDSIPAYNRVSIRAVLVDEGEDPGPALAAAGFVNPIAIPVALSGEGVLFGGMLGNGITPNLIGILETEQEDDFDSSPYTQPNKAVPRPDTARPAEPFITTLPAAFGTRAFAPIRPLGDTGQGPRPGRYGNRATVYAPTPSLFSQADPVGTAGWRNLYAYVGNDPINRIDPSGLCDSPQGCGWGSSNQLIGSTTGNGSGLLTQPNLGTAITTSPSVVISLMAITASAQAPTQTNT